MVRMWHRRNLRRAGSGIVNWMGRGKMRRTSAVLASPWPPTSEKSRRKLPVGARMESASPRDALVTRAPSPRKVCYSTEDVVPALMPASLSIGDGRLFVPLKCFVPSYCCEEQMLSTLLEKGMQPPVAIYGTAYTEDIVQWRMRILLVCCSHWKWT
eukprot:scaffold260053_cov28-Tisochrysis_lutea.AAC.1